MDVRMPDGTIIRGVPEGTTRAQLDAKLARRRQAEAAPEPRYMFDKKPGDEFDPTEGMGWGEKALVNVGAGMDTAWQGAKQLVGQGMTDEELKEKRRIDQQLADKTFGGGVIQTLGEIAPTIPLGLGAGALATRAGGAAAAAAASPTISAALGGAASGALMPVTEDESRLTNIGLGAAGGAVAPHALKLAMKGARGVGQVGERIVAAAPGRVGEMAAERAGARRLAGMAERDFEGGIAPDVYTPSPELTSRGYRPTAATVTQDPRVAGWERASRISNPEHWVDPDAAAHGARWRALDEGLQTQADVDAAIARSQEVGRRVPDVYAAAGPAKFDREMDRFHEALQEAKTSNVYNANGTVRDAVDYIEGTMARAGTVTPELVHLMKQELGRGLPGRPGIGDTAVRAASSDPKILDLMKSLDNILENATRGRYEPQGKYSQWKADYARSATEAEAAKADVNIRAKFIDPATGMLKKTATAEGEPQVTGHALSQAVIAAGSHKRGPKKGRNLLRQASQDTVNALARDLNMADIVRRSKAASTGGSGSDTAGNLALQAMIMEAMLPSGFGIGRYIQAEGNRKTQAAMQRQLAAVVQDPQLLRQVLRAAEHRRLLRGQTRGLAPGVSASLPLLLGGPRE